MSLKIHDCPLSRYSHLPGRRQAAKFVCEERARNSIMGRLLAAGCHNFESSAVVTSLHLAETFAAKLWKDRSLGELIGFRIRVAELFTYVGYDAASLCNWFPTFYDGHTVSKHREPATR
jgi:hypothetical protein